MKILTFITLFLSCSVFAATVNKFPKPVASEFIDTEQMIKITTYTDGTKETNSFNAATSSSLKQQTTEKSAIERLEKIKKRREERAAYTNMMTIVYGPESVNGVWRAPVDKNLTLSKLKLVMKCKEIGIWEDVKLWINEAGLYDEYLAAQVVTTDNTLFIQGLALFMQRYNISRKEVWDILNACKAD